MSSRARARHLLAVDHTSGRDPFGVSQEEVLGDRHVEHTAGVVAVLGHDGDPGSGHGPGRPGLDRISVDQDFAGSQVQQAREQVAQFALTVALHAGHADDLARSDAQVQVVEEPATVGAERRRPPNLQHRRTGWRLGRSGGHIRSHSGGGGFLLGRGSEAEGGSFGAKGHRAPDHRSRQRRSIGIGGGHPFDHLAVPHDRDGVGGVAYLVEFVADEGHRSAFLVDHSTQRGEQLLGLARGENRGRLVEDQRLGIAAQALDDLDPLAHPGREFADDSVGIDGEPVVPADVADPISHLAGIESTDVAEGNVLPHRQGIDEAEVLVHHADSLRCRVDRIQDPGGLAVDLHLPAVGQHQPDQHLHERRLPCAVLAQHAVDPTPVQGQIHGVAGNDLPEPLGDVDELDGGCGTVGSSRGGHVISS